MFLVVCINIRTNARAEILAGDAKTAAQTAQKNAARYDYVGVHKTNAQLECGDLLVQFA